MFDRDTVRQSENIEHSFDRRRVEPGMCVCCDLLLVCGSLRIAVVELA